MRSTDFLAAIAVAALTMGVAQADVTVGQGGETLFVLKSESDLGKTGEQRANDVYDRLRLILNNPKLKAGDIQVKELGNYGVKIVANKQLIVPIGAEEAKAHNMTPMELGKKWAAHLQKVLPKLNARPDLFQKKNTYKGKKKRTSR